MSPRTVNECVPLFNEGEAITATATAAITGKRCINISANVEQPLTGLAPDGVNSTKGGNIQVAHCAAAAKPIGVSSWDAAIGEKLYVVGGPGQVVPITAGAAITAGQEVEVGANGTVVPLAAGQRVGRAIADAANAADCFVKLY